MRWTVVYDFYSQGLSLGDWLFAAAPLVVVLAGIFMVRGGLRQWRAPVFILFGVLMAAIISFGMLRDYWRLIAAYREQTYKVVEGKVERFRPQYCGARPNESFDVAGVPFSYGQAEIKLGFGDTACGGGPIREGLYVRIWYVDRQSGRHIIHLEVRS